MISGTVQFKFEEMTSLSLLHIWLIITHVKRLFMETDIKSF